MTKNIILNHQEISLKIKRIAFQIFEIFNEELEIVVAGIDANGFIFAEKIADELAEIAPFKVVMCNLKIDKLNPTLPVYTSISKSDYENKSVILVDDVLNSGTTLIYGVKHFLEVPLKNFKTAVLIDRNHKKYPVKADIKGISLATSLYNHVQVVFEDNNNHAFLS